MFVEILDDLSANNLDPQDLRQVDDLVSRTEKSFRSELGLTYSVIRPKKGRQRGVIGSATVKAIILGSSAVPSSTLTENLLLVAPSGVQGHCFMETPAIGDQSKSLSREGGRILLFQMKKTPHPLPAGWRNAREVRWLVMRFAQFIWDQLPLAARKYIRASHPSTNVDTAANNFALAYQARVNDDAGDSELSNQLVNSWDANTVDFYNDFFANDLSKHLREIA